MEQVFNELSVDCYDSEYAAHQGMERLASLSREISNIGFRRNVRVTQNYGELPLAPGYTMSHWAKGRSGGIDRDLQRWFLTFVTQTPYVEDRMVTKQQEEEVVVQFAFQGSSCAGLGLASLLGYGALSLDGNPQFASSPVTISFVKVDDHGNLLEGTSDVESWFSSDQLPEIQDRFYEVLYSRVFDGESLVDNIDSLFSGLAFSENAVSQLRRLTGKEQYFREIIRHFRILNETMTNWSGGNFSPDGIDWSTESEATLNQYADQRKFVCADGIERQFKLHSKLKSPNMRIYYYPYPETKKVHIGYVGKHLQTKRYRT